MTKASDNPFPSILLEDHADPAAPTSGFHRLFVDTDEKLKMIDHASLVTDFTPGGGGLAHSYIGYNTVGGSTQAIGATTAVCKQVVLAAAGLLSTIDFYVAQAADNVYQTMIAGVWEDDSNKAGTIIFSSGGTAGAYYGGPSGTYPARWFAAPCGLYLPSGTYWIGMATGPACLVYYDTSGTDRTWDISANTQAVDGARWTQSDTTRKYSMRGSFWS